MKRHENRSGGNGKKITIAPAKTKKEIEDFQRFLFRVYCLELGWREARDFPGGLMADEYDRRASFIAIRSGAEIIGGMRIVKDSELGFPHEKELGLRLDKLGAEADRGAREKIRAAGRSGLREITRFAGKKTGRRVLTVDLAKGWYWYCVRNAVSVCFMAVDMRLFLMCEKLFIPLKPVGVPKWCEGSWVVPSVLVLDDMMASLKKNNPEARKYILDKSNLAGDWND